MAYGVTTKSKHMHNPPTKTDTSLDPLYFTDINQPWDPIPAMTWTFQVTKQDFTVYICRLLILLNHND